MPSIAPAAALLLVLGAGLAWAAEAPPGKARVRPGVAGPRRSSPAHPGGTARQQSLARFRRIQLEIRAYKQAQRRARGLERQQRREAESGRGPSGSGAREPVAVRPPRPARRDLLWVGLLGLGALADPAGLALAAPAPTFDSAALIGRYTAQATAGLDQLGPVCVLAALSAPPLPPDPPCGPAYRVQARGQVAALHTEMLALFVPPALLGAGACRPGESHHAAKSRIALAQSDVLADYDRLAADAAALQAQWGRDGYALQAAANAVLAAQEAGRAAGLPAIATFALGQVGTSLNGAGYGGQAIGDVFATIANMALSYRAGYQRWANGQTQALLGNCTGAPSPAAPQASPVPGPESPAPALDEAYRKLSAGCALAAQHRLELPVCAEDTFAELRLRNGTVLALYHDVACLATGLFAGTPSPCPGAPLADARTRSDTIADFNAFSGEINAVGFAAQGLGNALFAGSQVAVLAGNSAAQAGNATLADLLFVAGDGLMVSGRAIYADGYELMRIGALSRHWLADLIQAFNAESRAELDVQAIPSSRTGAGPEAPMAIGIEPGAPSGLDSGGTALDPLRFAVRSSTGEDSGAGLWPLASSTAPGPATGGRPGAPGPAAVATGSQADSSGLAPAEPAPGAPAEPATSAAGRTRGCGFAVLLAWFHWI
jgi:hypothetical protein